MENDDKNEIFTEDKEFNLDNVFKLDYENQNYKDKQQFQNWQNSMFKKYGDNARLFKCVDDNILFYTSDEDCKNYPLFKSTCPCCKGDVCYYCHRSSKDSYGNGTCCLSRKFYCLFFKMV